MLLEGKDAPATSHLAAGALLRGRYRILARLGSGGMGVVFQAHDLALGRDVAVKVVRAGNSPSLDARFRREAQLASRVSHPHTVYVIDAGELEDGSGFLVMELVKGKTLRAVLAESGRLEPRRVCRIGSMIASGMQSVHDAGIVHRDLKPANVFLLDDGAMGDFVKIVDFGVAKQIDLVGSLDGTAPSMAMPDLEATQDSGEADCGAGSVPGRGVLTRHGAIVGTLRYMAPEQIRADAIDARADQYALGCMLYELLTGVPPFAGEGPQVARGHLYGVPEPPRRLVPEAAISPELEAVVLRALSRQREARFPQMRALAAALTDQAERPSQRQEPPPARRISWRPVWAGTLTALAATAGILLTQSQLRGEQTARTSSHTEGARQTLPAPPQAPNQAEDPSGQNRQRVPGDSDEPARPAADRAARVDAAALVPRAASEARPFRAEPPAARASADSVGALLTRAAAAQQRGDAFAAQRLLQSVRDRCARAAPGCTEHAAEAAARLGRLYEADGQWAEALTEYSRALTSSRPGPAPASAPEWRQDAEAAMVRLSPRLGRVLLKRARGSRCEEVLMFLPPGEHRLALDGISQLITVRARETQRLGSCASP